MKSLSLLLALAVTFFESTALQAQIGRYDLVIDQRDANGLPLNPSWRNTKNPMTLDPSRECGILALAGTPGFRGVLLKNPSCFDDHLNLLRLNEARALRVLGGGCQQASEDGSIQGHLNFFPVTMTGVLRYNATGAMLTQLIGGDFDHTFELTPDTPRPMPVTRWNIQTRSESLSARLSPDTQSIHVELDIRETTRRVPSEWNPSNKWWQVLKSLGEISGGLKEPDNWPRGDSLLNLGLTTVTGIFNLDMVHGGHAEIHPVLGMAMLRNRVVRANGTQMREEWVVIARDRGNEGNCASGLIPFYLGPSPRLGDASARTVDTFRLRLRKPPGAAGRPAVSRPGASWLARTAPVRGFEFWWKESEGLDMAVFWPRPLPGQKDATILGALEVTWPGAFESRVAALSRDTLRFPPTKQREEPKRRHSLNDPEVAYYKALLSWNPLTESTDWDPTVRDAPSHWSPSTELAPVTIYHHEPAVTSCSEVPASTNPRCVGNWTLIPGSGMRLSGQVGRNHMFSIGVASPPLAVGNLHPALFAEFRRFGHDSTPTTSFGEIQLRISLPQLGSLLNVPGFYPILQAGVGKELRRGGKWFFAPAFGVGLTTPQVLRTRVAVEIARRDFIASSNGRPNGIWTFGVFVPTVLW